MTLAACKYNSLTFPPSPRDITAFSCGKKEGKLDIIHLIELSHHQKFYVYRPCTFLFLLALY
jgi:hypothetical protein